MSAARKIWRRTGWRTMPSESTQRRSSGGIWHRRFLVSPRVQNPAKPLLLVDVLFCLQPLHQSRDIGFLVVGCAGQRKLHFRSSLVEITIAHVYPGETGVHEPLVGMFFRVRAEDCEGFVLAIFRL